MEVAEGKPFVADDDEDDDDGELLVVAVDVSPSEDDLRTEIPESCEWCDLTDFADESEWSENVFERNEHIDVDSSSSAAAASAENSRSGDGIRPDTAAADIRIDSDSSDVVDWADASENVDRHRRVLF